MMAWSGLKFSRRGQVEKSAGKKSLSASGSQPWEPKVGSLLRRQALGICYREAHLRTVSRLTPTSEATSQIRLPSLTIFLIRSI